MHATWQQPEDFSEDTMRSAQRCLERLSMEIKEEVRDWMKMGQFVDALRDSYVPELSKALFPREEAQE